jgi:2-polyprenyl-3-methyl-5-hydroxy-6-metoxy-1,4-benzoquinol methylase
MGFFNKISEYYMNRHEKYDKNYYLKNHINALNSPFGCLVKLYYRYIASYIMARPANLKKGDKVLDIGCGVGILVNQFNRLGYNGTGVDVNREAIKNSIFPSKCVLTKTTGKLDFPDNNFDLVVSREVLEHIAEENIDQCIKEWDRVSKGKMIHIIAVSERGPSAVDDPAHINVQDVNWWVGRFKKHGYKAIRQPQKLFLSPFGREGYLMFIKD